MARRYPEGLKRTRVPSPGGGDGLGAVFTYQASRLNNRTEAIRYMYPIVL